MLYERYVIQPKEGQTLHNIFDIAFDDDDFEEVTIESDTFQFTKRHFPYPFDNASYDNLIVIFTKPNVLYTNEENRELFHIKVGYVKTKADQLIVNTQNWDVVNHLNEYQGLIDFIDIFVMPYNNMAKIAVEYKYHSISPTVLFDVIKHIFSMGFIRFGISVREDLEIVKDFLQTDFEETFNQSRRNKKIIIHMDTVNNGNETINSAKIEYSIKADVSFENAFSYLRSQSQDNIVRYSIKCEDEDAKTSSIDGFGEDLRTSEWEKPARKSIEVTEFDLNFFRALSTFLRRQDD